MMNQKLNDLARRSCHGRLAFFLEGGYNIDVMGYASQNLLEEIMGRKVTPHHEEHAESTTCISYTEELIKVLRTDLEGIWF